MRLKRTVMAGVLMLAGIAAAQAADLTPVMPTTIAPAAPPPPPAFSWTGPYVGVLAGWGWGWLHWRFVPVPTSPTPNPQRTTGPVAGATVGYNYQAGNLVFGAEGDFAWARIDGTAACPNVLFSCDSALNWLGTLRARAGVAFGQLMIYATGGLAVGQQRIQTVQPGGAIPPSGTPVNGTTLWALGWTAGAGIEVAFSHGLSAKIEGLYYDLGTDTYAVDNSTPVTARHHGVLVRAGLNWNFGAP
jgi:outer membrane immunogenic protein